MDHAPIPPEFRAQMNGLAKGIDDVLNGGAEPRQIGFALLMYPFGHVDAARINYIGNGKRADVLVALKELVARWEGRHQEPERPQ